MNTQLKIKLFASLKEKVDSETITLEPDQLPINIKDLLKNLASSYPALEKDLPYCRVAINREYGSSDDIINSGDEIALIPPVSGG